MTRHRTTRPSRELLHLEEHLDRWIGLRLTGMRLNAGCTVCDLASQTGVPAEELADHEQGSLPVPLSRLVLVCRAMGWVPGHLVMEAVRTLASWEEGSPGCTPPRRSRPCFA